jgi:lysophospholipase L1-like esterase
VAATLAKPGKPVIENAGALAPFFDRLAEVERNPALPVHILQFVDSHTAADLFTGQMRLLFQQRFGDGGAGFSFAGHPFAGYRIGGTSRAQSAGWSTVGTHFLHLPDPMLGLGGVGIETDIPGEEITLGAHADRVELEYLQQPHGGEIAVTMDDSEASSDSVTATDGPLGAASLAVPTPGGEHNFTVRTRDDAPVRLLGWVTENKAGATYEALGINGAEAPVILRWDEAMQSAFLERRHPSLIVLAYGTNEAANSSWTFDSYRSAFASILQRIHRATPEVAILVIGPADRYVHVRGRTWTPVADPISKIIAAQKSACKEYGCAYWDQRERMGGTGSMRDWVSAQWAQADHTHFTNAGYQQLANALYSDLMQAYASDKPASPPGKR